MNYATAALLTYYFYVLDDQKDGAHVIACFKAIKNDTPASEAIATHLLRGRSHAELEKELISAFKKEGLTLNFVSRGSAP
jgi:hypothetical protein